MKIHLIPGPGRRYEPERKGNRLIKAANHEKKCPAKATGGEG
jgi:hypothetical protein